MKKLTPTEIKTALAQTKRWQKKAAVITRTCEFKDFPEAMTFVNRVAKAAEQAQHHPDIDIRWNKVKLSLTTHDAGGLTENDFAMAARINKLAD